MLRPAEHGANHFEGAVGGDEHAVFDGLSKFGMLIPAGFAAREDWPIPGRSEHGTQRLDNRRPVLTIAP